MVKASFPLEIFIFFSWHFGHVEKWLNKKAKIDFKIYDFIGWTTNNHHTHITQYIKS